MLSRKPSPASQVHSPTALPDEHFRNHMSDSAEDALLERWTKVGEAVLAHGAPTEAHISEMTALARAEQEQIKRKMGRTMRMFRQGQKKAA
jgi:hypothetical protein